MPIMRQVKGKPMLSKMDEYITKMSMKELIDYEACLWNWMDKAGSPVDVARQLNMIHREVEWRAQDT